MYVKSVRGVAAACTVAAVCWSTFSFAADVAAPVVKAPPPEPAMWTYVVTPYVWMPSIDGTSTIKGRSIDVDATFIDLLHRQIPKELFGLMGTLEARKGQVSIWTDLVYMKVGASDSAARSRNVHPNVGGSLAASASVKFEMFIAEAAIAHELWHARGAAPGSATSIDVYGGGRFWWQKAEGSLALTAGLNIADLAITEGRAIANSGDVTWFDPLVGLRLRHHFSPGTELVVRGDVGGFGAGSNISWQAMGYLNWEFARTQRASWNAMLGYRALYVDFEKGAGNTLYEYDMLTHGPVIGVTARF